MDPEVRTVGLRVRQLRKTRGLTQQQLADRAHVSKSLIRKVERGERPATPSTIDALARALGTTTSGLLASIDLETRPADRRLHEAIPRLERALLSLGLPLNGDEGVAPGSLPQLELRARRATRLRLSARYTQLAELLPGFIEDVAVVAESTSGRNRARAFSTLAAALRCLDAIVNKTGYLHLSYLAVDKACWAARESADPLLIATSVYLQGQSCLDVGHFDGGLALLDKAQRSIEPDGRSKPDQLSVYGSLHLRSAVLAACRQDSERAWAHLDEARVVAARIGGDVTRYGTYFGPTNTGIHTVATAVELGDYVRAVEEARRVRLDPTLPKERSSHHYIDLARAYLRLGDRERSLHSLMLAEQLAPHHTRYHSATRTTVYDLLQASQRTSDTLAGLAQRVGIGS